VRLFYENSRTFPLLVALACAAALLSCEGSVDDPKDVIDRMVKAYGGSEKTVLLGTFVGKGYMKDKFSQAVARSWPYDVWQRGIDFKSRLVMLDKGVVKDIRYSLYDSLGTYRVSKRFDQLYRSPPEMELLKYRFPSVLEWVQGDTLSGKLIDEGGTDGICKLEFYDGSRRVQIGVSRDTWLLHDISAQLKEDTMRVFVETYTDYWEVDGIPIPGRYSSTVDGLAHYEYTLVAVEFGMELPDSVFTVTQEERAEIPVSE
jgi:hypothetical protein